MRQGMDLAVAVQRAFAQRDAERREWLEKRCKEGACKPRQEVRRVVCACGCGSVFETFASKAQQFLSREHYTFYRRERRRLWMRENRGSRW